MYSQMQIGQQKSGMQTLNQSLCALYMKKLITIEDAMGYSPDVDELRTLIQTGGVPVQARPAVQGNK